MCIRDRLQPAEGVLQEILKRGTPLEQAIASAVLLRLGDRKQIERLKALRSQHDPAIRHLVLDALAGDRDFVAQFLSDSVDAVRLHAARILAVAGDKRAIPVLKAFFAVGGVDGLLAAGLLRRLGITCLLYTSFCRRLVVAPPDSVAPRHRPAAA